MVFRSFIVFFFFLIINSVSLGLCLQCLESPQSHPKDDHFIFFKH